MLFTILIKYYDMNTDKFIYRRLDLGSAMLERYCGRYLVARYSLDANHDNTLGRRLNEDG